MSEYKNSVEDEISSQISNNKISGDNSFSKNSFENQKKNVFKENNKNFRKSSEYFKNTFKDNFLYYF